MYSWFLLFALLCRIHARVYMYVYVMFLNKRIKQSVTKLVIVLNSYVIENCTLQNAKITLAIIL